jgi:hypothetical protein
MELISSATTTVDDVIFRRWWTNQTGPKVTTLTIEEERRNREMKAYWADLTAARNHSRVATTQTKESVQTQFTEAASKGLMPVEDIYNATYTVYGNDESSREYTHHMLTPQLQSHEARIRQHNWFVAGLIVKMGPDYVNFIEMNGPIIQHCGFPLFPAIPKFYAMNLKLLAEVEERRNFAASGGGLTSDLPLRPSCYKQTGISLITGGDFWAYVEEGPDGRAAINLKPVQEEVQIVHDRIDETQKVVGNHSRKLKKNTRDNKDRKAQSDLVRMIDARVRKASNTPASTPRGGDTKDSKASN